MKRKPSLDLQLFPLSPSSPSSSSEFHDDHSIACLTYAWRSTCQSRACSVRRSSITIVYNAQAGNCDTSELQALAILWHARRELEGKYNISRSNLRTPFLHFQLHSPYGLSLRKSLQRFLQKRRDRIQAANPY